MDEVHTEQCDYDALKNRARWLRQYAAAAVISPDLDGVLSALLGQLFGWRVAGFYSLDNLWILEKDKALSTVKPIFVDHDIFRREIPSVGHHMLKWSTSTSIPEHESAGTQSLNPNLLRGFTLRDNFERKYPFGTIHFLLACYQAWGDLKDYKPSEAFIPVLLHVDSSLQNAFTYEKNAMDWLDWLGARDNPTAPLHSLCSALTKTSSKRLFQWKIEIGDKIEALGFRRHSQCTTTDPLDPEQWDRFGRLVEWLEGVSGWSGTFPKLPQESVSSVRLIRKRDKPTKANFRAMIQRKPFSYALISGGEGGLNYADLPPNW